MPVFALRSTIVSGTRRRRRRPIRRREPVSRRATVDPCHREQQSAKDQRAKAEQQKRPSPQAMRRPADPRRKNRHGELRDDYRGGDHQRRRFARSQRQHARRQRQHCRVGEMKQDEANGEDDERPVASDLAEARGKDSGFVGVPRAASGRGPISSARIDKSAKIAGKTKPLARKKTARSTDNSRRRP